MKKFFYLSLKILAWLVALIISVFLFHYAGSMSGKQTLLMIIGLFLFYFFLAIYIYRGVDASVLSGVIYFSVMAVLFAFGLFAGVVAILGVFGE
ncbi:hypothetical protein [Paraburkholderia adhaesiva]|uniref:hypothetical protein n=1 Tax=Paraburkholderia adhaesiva TaxID=2883244 RepID=UPI001F1B4CE4|nr:hypothetical protein [Paraburkholderia adhaesiva]